MLPAKCKVVSSSVFFNFRSVFFSDSHFELVFQTPLSFIYWHIPVDISLRCYDSHLYDFLFYFLSFIAFDLTYIGVSVEKRSIFHDLSVRVVALSSHIYSISCMIYDSYHHEWNMPASTSSQALNRTNTNIHENGEKFLPCENASDINVKVQSTGQNKRFQMKFRDVVVTQNFLDL